MDNSLPLTRDSPDKEGVTGLIKNSDDIAAAVPELDIEWLDRCLEEAVDQVSPRASLERFLKTQNGKELASELLGLKENLRVFGAGKASSDFARAFSSIFHPAHKCEMNGPVDQISDFCLVRKGTHPVPDESTIRNSEKLLESALATDNGDTVLFLLSGGASSIFAIPHQGIELSEKIEISRGLIGNGASISELNCFRRHFSKIKGGRLAASLYPRRVITFAISDVPTGRLEDIGSGPTVPDPTTCRDVLDVLQRYTLTNTLSSQSTRMLLSGELESLKPGSTMLSRAETSVIASNGDAVLRFAESSAQKGIRTVVSDSVVNSDPVTTARQLIDEGRRKLRGKGVLVAGGETVIGVPLGGRGGRCQHVALVASEMLKEGEFLVAFGTDGIDGNSIFAGGIGRRSEDDVHNFIEAYESERYLKREGRGIITGATGTNVSDLYVYCKL